MKKLVSLLLALVIILSLIPMNAMAFSLAGKLPNLNDIPVTEGKPDLTTKEEEHKKEFETLTPELKVPAKKPVYYHEPGKHEYGYGCNTQYHWLQCPCGCQISMEPHVDPKDAENDYCFCGYHFSDNADLVTLWIDGCPPVKGFNKNKTEYKLNAYTYKDVKEIKVATTTFDSEATVELPEDLTLKDGENKFEVKVTSENQKVTKVYTVIINKEAKK